MSDRGMKKWAPYASLIEQKGVMAKMLYNRKKVARPHISHDQAELIERQLIQYQGEHLNITYFDDGFILKMVTTITKIDSFHRLIVCDDVTISYCDIIAIE